jgi:hypothetical protein
MLVLNQSINSGDGIRVEIDCPDSNASCSFPILGGSVVVNATDIEVVIGRGVTLVAQYNLSAWPVNDTTLTFMPLLEFDYCSFITVRGERDLASRSVSRWHRDALSATVDGGGLPWWIRKLTGNGTGSDDDPKTPCAFGFHECADVNLRDVHVSNSPSFGVYFSNSRRVVIERSAVTIDTIVDEVTVPVFALNTDGFDVGGRDILIRDVFVSNADDSIAIKPSWPTGSWRGDMPCTENVTVENSTLIGVGASIGSVHPHYDTTCVRNVVFRDIEMPNTMKGIYIKTDNKTDEQPSDALLISDVLYENVRIDGASWWPIWIGPQQQENDLEVTECRFSYPLGTNRNCLGARQGNVTNITLRNVSITNSKRAHSGMILGNAGSPAGPWDLILDHVTADQPIGCASARVGLKGTDPSLFFTAPNDATAGYEDCTFYEVP